MIEVDASLSYTYFQEVIAKHKDLIWKVIEYEEDGVTPKEVEIQKLKKNKKLFWFCLHFINGVKSAGILIEGVRYCCHCKTYPLNEEGDVGSLNLSGYCDPHFRHEARGVRCNVAKRHYDAIFSSHTSYYRTQTRLCEVCGTALNRDNTIGICTTNPECTQVHRRAKYDLDKEPASVCKICGIKLRRNNTTGICTTNLECTKAYRQARYDLDKEPASVCRNCGITLRKDNTARICEAWPDCKKENKKLIRQRSKEQQGSAPVCRNCGKRLFRKNSTGFCRENPECIKTREHL